MSKREQFLITLFLIALVVVGLMLGYTHLYEPRYKKAKLSLENAKQQIRTGQNRLEIADQITEEQQWLSKNEPYPVTPQGAQAGLQTEAQELAESTELNIKSQNLLASVENKGSHYNRARINMIVTGTEANFFRWVNAINDPAKFRRVTYLRINPLKDDDTQVESKVTIEQWFVPETPQ